MIYIYIYMKHHCQLDVIAYYGEAIATRYSRHIYTYLLFQLKSA